MANSKCSFPGITHISEKDIQMPFAVEICLVGSSNSVLGHMYT